MIEKIAVFFVIISAICLDRWLIVEMQINLNDYQTIFPNGGLKVKKNTMENNNEMISDLKDLVSIVNDGKEGYESAAETTENLELKAVFLGYATERKAYEVELKAHLAVHGSDSENSEGGILGALHRTWIDIKEALSSKEDVAILGAIETGEKAAVEKYDAVINHPSLHADHLELLTKQRNGIQKALENITALKTERA